MNVPDRSSVQTAIDQFLSEHSLPASDESACPYLPDQLSSSEGFFVEDFPGEVYQALLDRNFRRSGQLIYRPVCASCRACRQIRLPVADFRMSRSQRRVRRQNDDVSVILSSKPQPSDEKWEMFRSYLDERHDDTMPSTYEVFVDFLYASPVESIEFSYRVDGRLIAVSIADVCPDALSSVYAYFDPAESKRSPGTLSVLSEIEYCRRMGLTYYYLGYYVAGSKTMEYKARFGPHELLDDACGWVSGGASSVERGMRSRR